MLLLAAGCGLGDSATDSTSAGSAILSWDPPTQNTDGAPLTDLAGYYIHYGTSANDLTQTIAVQGGDVSAYEITNLAQGTYYFAVTAYALDGSESVESNIASKSISNSP
jgi:hypothetical protein